MSSEVEFSVREVDALCRQLQPQDEEQQVAALLLGEDPACGDLDSRSHAETVTKWGGTSVVIRPGDCFELPIIVSGESCGSGSQGPKMVWTFDIDTHDVDFSVHLQYEKREGGVTNSVKEVLLLPTRCAAGHELSSGTYFFEYNKLPCPCSFVWDNSFSWVQEKKVWILLLYRT